MRTFISIELKGGIKKKIGRAIKELKDAGANVKWVEPGNLHVTLKFLGEVPDKDIENLIALVSAAVKSSLSFKAEFMGTGSFPAGRHPRVIWIGTTKGGEEQSALASKLEDGLCSAGFEREARKFKSHITIGRVRESGNLARVLKKLNELKCEPFGGMIVDHINIMKSKLSPKGPTYEIVKSLPLKIKKEE